MTRFIVKVWQRRRICVSTETEYNIRHDTTHKSMQINSSSSLLLRIPRSSFYVLTLLFYDSLSYGTWNGLVRTTILIFLNPFK